MTSVAVCAGAESTPIFGSLRNRPTHWLTRKISATRFRSLPVDEHTPSLKGKAGGGGEDATPAGKDIRNLFQQAGHQGEDATGRKHLALHLLHLAERWLRSSGIGHNVIEG